MTEEEIKALTLRLSGAHFTAIGKVASNWAVFEQIANSFLWELAEINDRAGACITAQIPHLGRTLAALLALVRLRGGNDALISDINKFQRDTEGLGRRRNRIVHDPWDVDDETGHPRRLEISADKRPVFGFEIVPISEVERLVDEIGEHTDRFIALANRALAEVGPLPEMPS